MPLSFQLFNSPRSELCGNGAGVRVEIRESLLPPQSLTT
jgi:hypothetical protein